MNDDDAERSVMQAIWDAVAKLPVRTHIGRITENREGFLAVTLPSGRTECEVTGSVQADIDAHQPVTPNGREALVEIVPGRAIATGIIWTGA